MLADVERFVTRMKLQELRRQRDQLRIAYDHLARHSRDASSDVERLRRLYQGLHALKVAGRPLHPDVANLEILLDDAQEPVAASLISFWLAQLEQELARGRLRSEFAYVFGALLEQRMVPAGEPAGDAQARLRQQLVDDLVTPAPPFGERSLLEPLMPILERLPVPDDADQYLGAVGELQVRHLATAIRDNPFRSPRQRQQARSIAADQIIANELADALTVVFAQRDTWEWPAAGVPAWVGHAGGKWRLFLDEDVPSALFLERYAGWLRDRLTLPFRGTVVQHVHRLRNRRQLGAPDQDIHNEQRLLVLARATPFLDIWGDAGIDVTAPLEDQLEQGGEHVSIIGRRLAAMEALSETVWEVDYRQEGYPGGLRQAIQLLNAEVKLWQAAFPGQPLYVLKLDLKDFYPSIAHDVIAFILERLALPPADHQLIARMLRVPIRFGDDVRVVERGLMNNRSLSHLLGDLLLRLLDEHLHRAATVEIIRVVDDICILAASVDDLQAAWHAASAFCAATGLAINTAKSGAVAIGGRLPDGLPEGLPTWKLLRLGPDGEWDVDPDGLQQRLDETRARVDQAASVLAKVEVYNRAARELLADLAVDVRLGRPHRDRIREVATRFHHRLAGERGIADLLREDIRAGFLGHDATVEIPEAWLYFPITAGGLSLRHPLVEIAAYALADEHAPEAPRERPRDWQLRDNRWAAYYRSWLREVEPKAPSRTVVMESLVADFIKRGSQMSGKPQHDLSTYWRWILYTYGPQIVDRFGSFRFLITELVPLQLILQGRVLGDGDSLGAEG